MDLVQQVAATLKIDDGKAEKGIGAILMALRSTVDPETFGRVKDALPNSESLMGHALMSGARTAELPAMIGPARLAAALGSAGFGKDDIPNLGRMVLEFLRPAIGAAAIDKFLEAAPGLAGNPANR